MKSFFILATIAVAFSSCADEMASKPVGPVSNSSTIPWNDPGLAPGQGGGQFGMLEQNRHRR